MSAGCSGTVGCGVVSGFVTPAVVVGSGCELLRSCKHLLHSQMDTGGDRCRSGL